jgi:hypothetical protein
MKKSNRIKALAWAVWCTTTGIMVYGIISDSLYGFPNSIASTLLIGLVLSLFLTVGVLVATQRPENPIGWFILAGAFFLSFAGATNWAGNLGFGILIVFTFLYFPNGRLPSSRWRPVLWFAAIVFPTRVVSDIFHLTFLEPILNISAIALMLAALTAIIVRYRKAGAAERQQIKWVAFSAILGAILFALGLLGLLSGWASEMFFNLIWISFIISIPLTLAIAILRYHLWDVDLIIRRTLVYGGLTATLALVYFGGVVVLQELFQVVTGQHRSPIATVISTLVIAALFTPLRRRIQRDIDRRFYRRKYDAQKTLESFAAKARDEVELDQLTAHLVAVVQESMQPEQVSLWLRKPHR